MKTFHGKSRFQMKRFVPRQTLINVYTSMILPHFEYFDHGIWENCGIGLPDKLQKMQNKAARVITGKTYDVRSSETLRELDWLILENRWKCIIKLYSCIKLNTPMSLRNVWLTFLE